VTAAFLKSFLISTFNLNPFTNITSISIVPTGNSGTNNPAEIGYNVSVGFSGSIIPSSADLDTLIHTAFSQPSIQALLTSLGALPSSNPFSSTSNASYSTTIKIKSLPVTTKTLEDQWKQKHSAFGANLFLQENNPNQLPNGPNNPFKFSAIFGQPTGATSPAPAESFKLGALFSHPTNTECPGRKAFSAVSGIGRSSGSECYQASEDHGDSKASAAQG